MIGEKLGSYEITEEIGKGGMATVYRAYHKNMDRHVAVKIIHAAILNDKIARVRFQREAKLIAKLEHPHLLPVYDFDGSHDPPYIVMRFLEGGTLTQVMAEGALPQGEIFYMLRQIASSLDYAHRQGIVHRDLKPSNIMIDKEGNAFVADFGIARQESSSEELTETGSMVGTPAYMSPEQAKGQSGVDHRTDIYALAVIIYEMLAGVHPFPRKTLIETLMAHIQAPVPSILTVNKKLPKALDFVMKTALSKDKEKRYPSAGGLVNAVAKALKAEASSAPEKLRELTGTFAASQLESMTKETDTGIGSSSKERQRQLTAVYLDVTEWAEVLYAEHKEQTDVKKKMDTLWDSFIAIAQAHNGILQSRTDEIGVALWGLEGTNEIDPEQAIRAALGMKAASLTAVQELWGAEYGPNEENPLPFIAGITTGPVLLETDDTGTQTATGPTITLAGRLKDAAPPGEVLVAHDTFTHVRGVFDFLPLTALRIRGRKDLLEIYIAQQARPRAFRSQGRGIEGVDVQMIGREVELRILQNALNLTIEDKETQVVTVVGEAGVGKSRLLLEFSNWIDLHEERLWFFEARATQPSQLQPYSLTRDLFSFRFEISDNDLLSVVHQKFVDGIITFMGEGSEDKARLIGQLVGFDFSEDKYVKSELQDVEIFQAKALGFLGEFFTTAARTQSVFIQVEDIHWADDRSLDLLSGLANQNQNLPLFIIYMARPGLFNRRASWGEGQLFHHKVQLEPLARLDARLLVKELLKKIDIVPTELRDLVIARAEGNPFYIEELIKTLIDDKVILKEDPNWGLDMEQFSDIRIPQTLTGVIQSRLDALDPAQLALMQRASVVGRVFWGTAATYISNHDGVQTNTIINLLEVLREREMILKREESNFEGTPEYLFRHAILRDVTYESIVPTQRREYHKLVAEWVISVSKDRQEEFTALIAEHYQAAGENALAATQYFDAGERISRQGTLDEAITMFKRALALLDGEEHAAQRATVNLELAWTLALIGLLQEGVVAIETALVDAKSAGREDLTAKALVSLGGAMMFADGATDESMETILEGLKLAEKVNDLDSIYLALRSLVNGERLRGNADASLAYQKRGMEIAKQLKNDEYVAQMYNGLGNIEGGIRGDPEKADEAYQDGLAIARKINHKLMIATFINNIGNRYLQQSQYAEAKPYFIESVEIVNERGGALVTVGYNIATTLFGLDELEEGIKYLVITSKEAQAVESILGYLFSSLTYAHLLGRQGKTQRALEVLGMVKNHPNMEGAEDEDFSRILSEVSEGMSEKEINAAMKKGETLKPEEINEEILALES